jgi:hypothetical protein
VSWNTAAVSEDARRDVLRRFGASPAEQNELLAHNTNRFAAAPSLDELPFPDEPFVSAWEQRVLSAQCTDAWTELCRWMPQLWFPVARGVSQLPTYRDATQRGTARSRPAAGLVLNQPESIGLELHTTLAGRIPLIRTPCRDDFVLLVQALAHRNEPSPVPASMGACAIGGHVNWQLKSQPESYCLAPEVSAADRTGVSAFRDRFIIAVDGPYSGVSASALGLEPSEWNNVSRRIRAEHECAHYITRRLCGSMSNSLLDELLADYFGIVAACGSFRSDWFLAFMGLRDNTLVAGDGRVNNYRGSPVLSDGAFQVQVKLLRTAVQAVERFDALLPRPRSIHDRTLALLVLTTCTLESLCCDDTVAQLASRLPSFAAPAVPALLR